VEQLWIPASRRCKAQDQQLLLVMRRRKGSVFLKRDVRQRIGRWWTRSLQPGRRMGAELEQRYGMVTHAPPTCPATMSERQFRKWMTGHLRRGARDQVKTELIGSRLRTGGPAGG
jgi:hypothetical protein